LVNIALAIVLTLAVTGVTRAEDETNDTDTTTTDTYRSPWADENETDPFATPSIPAKPQIGFHVREEAARYKVRRRRAKT
jgi:hypothetical protein